MGGSCHKLLHLRVEDRDWSFHDRDRLIEYHFGDQFSLGGLQQSGEVQSQVLWVHLCRKGVLEAFALAARDFRAILSGREIAHNDRWIGGARNIDWCGQRTAHKDNFDGGRLIVLYVDYCSGRVSIDELHAEYFGLREGGLDFDG